VSAPENDVPVRDPKRLAVLRFIFGQAQIIGATAGLVFLVQTGISPLTIWTVVITGLATLVSRLMFHGYDFL